MAINFRVRPVDGFDKELLLIGEGYIARPVTVNKDTITGLAPTDTGKYIIPQGTYLYGQSESLLINPNQIAKEASVSETVATATLGSSVVITAKTSGSLAYTVTISAGVADTLSNSISYNASTKTATLVLEADSDGTITATYGDVVALINNDPVVNSLIVAEMASGVDGDTVAVAGTATTASGGDEEVTGDIDGILYHSVDVTDGEATGALIIAGYINVDNMPVEPGDAVKAKLPRITFARRD